MVAFHTDIELAAGGSVVACVGLVDPDALRLHLPQAVVELLGLRRESGVFSRQRDGCRELLDRATGIDLNAGRRSAVFAAVVEPEGRQVVVGRMVLTELDLVPSGYPPRLVPRDPHTLVTEIE